ncbi:hypothetical protein O181_067755 [Austropuccinia psidii MF-1]|uniref:Uncharacterized protein n=1 Tax=Austropuccinia psidii MF-1 TaxID=1389203 RepID=A0A9Q3I6F2_9BASI|nr:hypothetical protein [Austropuccinia psidii MF-1]
MKGGGPKPKMMARRPGPPRPKIKDKGLGVCDIEMAKEASDGRIWPEARNGQMAIEHQRGPIGHKRYGVVNWPQLGSRLELPQHPWRRDNLCGCDTSVLSFEICR